ncbi:MAG: hypothetical protein J3R72DRAFT_445051 [Linnemannia gamsii]|nr:MAG: hypothetical protein J3R72DRAFT_445051 [Linnemannia gamsii]
MDTIIIEEIMSRTFSYILLFQFLFCILSGVTVSYIFRWLGQKFPRLSPFGDILFITFLILNPQGIIFPSYIGPLYSARGEANKCLDLLRVETLTDPIKTNYLRTSGSCTAILRLSQVRFANRATAEREIDRLTQSVASSSFVGTSRMSSGSSSSFDDDVEESIYTSLHCTSSWGGIAQWIAKRQLGYSTPFSLKSTSS